MKKLTKTHRLLLVVVAVIIIVTSVVACCTKTKNSNDTTTEPTTNKVSSTQTTATESTTDIPTTTQKETAVVAPEQPEELLSSLQSAGYSLQKLNDLGCRQLIIVKGNGNTGKMTFYQSNKNIWSEVDGTNCSVYVGKNGMTSSKTEGDGCTPRGLYSIGSAFYKENSPKTAISTFKITEDSYWVDDPESVFYNKYVEGTEKKDWSSAEHMMDYPGYKYGFTVNYNTKCEAGKGSAIFVHVGYNPTAGCVATNEENIIKYLSLLDKNAQPYILFI